MTSRPAGRPAQRSDLAADVEAALARLFGRTTDLGPSAGEVARQ
jgi:hypothetical protein